jgi:hypothetical protein
MGMNPRYLRRMQRRLQANIDIQWEDLEDQSFLDDIAGATAAFTAEKLVPKGLKAVKGAKVSAADDDFSPVTTKKPAASKPASKANGKKKGPPKDDDEEEGDEVLLEFGLAPTPNDKAVKKPAHKRPKVQKIDSSEIPAGKIDLPEVPSVAEDLAEAMENDDSDA